MELPEKETLTEIVWSELNNVGKNQLELANKLEIKPSTLSRDLNNETNTSYKRMRKIQEVLQEWKTEQQQPAKELMTEGFTSATLDETRQEVADKMQENYFSQLPVRESEEDEVIGMVTDTDLMKISDDNKLIGEMKDDDELQHIIKVDKEEKRQLIEKILDEGHRAVLVVDDGTSIGIITKADLLESTSPTV
jgi:predicted transcriptional regulator